MIHGPSNVKYNVTIPFFSSKEVLLIRGCQSIYYMPVLVNRKVMMSYCRSCVCL